MRIVERVKGELAVAAVANQAHLSQLPQVMRDGGGRGSHGGGQIGHTKLAAGQSLYDVKAGGVGQDLEGVGDEGELVVAAEAGAGRLNGVGVEGAGRFEAGGLV